jgi:hypothetical protein
LDKNIVLPLSLLCRVIDLLACLDPPDCHELRRDYCDVLWALRVKKQKVELGGSYAKIISAANPGPMGPARASYLRNKRQLEASSYYGTLL